MVQKKENYLKNHKKSSSQRRYKFYKISERKKSTDLKKCFQQQIETQTGDTRGEDSGSMKSNALNYLKTRARSKNRPNIILKSQRKARTSECSTHRLWASRAGWQLWRIGQRTFRYTQRRGCREMKKTIVRNSQDCTVSLRFWFVDIYLERIKTEVNAERENWWNRVLERNTQVSLFPLVSQMRWGAW